MKRLIAGVIAVLFIIGCTTATTNLDVSVDKGRTTRVETESEYYETVYWGDEQECTMSDNTTYIGRCSKTYQVYPEDDVYWVKQENSDGDAVDVTLVWDMPESPVLGICFYNDEAPDGQPKENCGVIVFDSLTSKYLFMNEFDQSGIINVMPLQGSLHEEAARQIESTKDMTIGEDCNYCKWLDDQMKRSFE